MYSIARVGDTYYCCSGHFRNWIFVLYPFDVFVFVWREVDMSCIVALVALWCIHANAREIAEFFKNLRVLPEGLVS